MDIQSLDHLSIYEIRATNNMQPSLGEPQLLSDANQVKCDTEKRPPQPSDEDPGTAMEQRGLPSSR